ncbi:hypothetical protein M405DRAFT_33078 [Rhizopogon salebrosus TDB-379]|nr:hypothetical protein M405DRAFT_33078 [Rhizopogon salebrosus TDB-379]
MCVCSPGPPNAASNCRSPAITSPRLWHPPQTRTDSQHTHLRVTPTSQFSTTVFDVIISVFSAGFHVLDFIIILSIYGRFCHALRNGHYSLYLHHHLNSLRQLTTFIGYMDASAIS